MGFESGGLLTESVRRKPYQVVLLDEIEKVTLIFVFIKHLMKEDLLIHMATVNFRNTLIIMTSNIGAKILLSQKIKRN